MKAIICKILICVALHLNAASQVSQKKDTCTTYLESDIKAYIPGHKDTLLDGKPIAFIDPATLLNGFQLQLRDSGFTVLKFTFTFDGDFFVAETVVEGNKLIPINNSEFSYDKIAEAYFITVEKIKVKKDGKCYILSPLIYITPRGFSLNNSNR